MRPESSIPRADLCARRIFANNGSSSLVSASVSFIQTSYMSSRGDNHLTWDWIGYVLMGMEELGRDDRLHGRHTVVMHDLAAQARWIHGAFLSESGGHGITRFKQCLRHWSPFLKLVMRQGERETTSPAKLL
jgi:hypothetical protein